MLNIPHEDIIFSILSFEFQVEFYTMCRAKCAVITVRANIMEYLRVMDVLVSLSVQFDDHGIMYAKQKRREIALSIKPIEISVVHVD